MHACQNLHILVLLRKNGYSILPHFLLYRYVSNNELTHCCNSLDYVIDCIALTAFAKKKILFYSKFLSKFSLILPPIKPETKSLLNLNLIQILTLKKHLNTNHAQNILVMM